MKEHYDRIQAGPHPEEYVPSATDALYLYGRSFFLKDKPLIATIALVVAYLAWLIVVAAASSAIYRLCATTSATASPT